MRRFEKYLIIVMVTSVLTLYGYSQTPPVTKICAAVYADGTWNVPINVTGFVNAGNISMKMNYDSSMLIYAGYSLNGGLNPGNVVVSPIIDQTGVFSLSYSSSTAITLIAPVNTLLTISFTPKPDIQGVHTLLTWSPFQGDCEIAPPVPEQYTPPITAANMSTYFINGTLDIPPVPVITGPNTACSGSSGNVYTTESGMSGYIWNISAGGIINSGSGTNSISVTWNTAGSHSVSVIYTHPLAGPALIPVSYPVTVSSCMSSLNLSLYLEGLYAGAGKMKRAKGVSGYQFTGTTADVIQVELHDPVDYAIIVYTAVNINLDSTGICALTIPSEFNGSYYITVRHRNSIETVSSAPVSLASSPVNYSFSGLASQSFGDNTKNMGGVFLIYAGDVDQNGFVGVSDMAMVDNRSMVFGFGYLPEDVDGDGFVGVSDMGIIDNNSRIFIYSITP